MKLNYITQNIGYLENRTKIGIIKFNNEVILIDSGLDDSVGRKVLRVLEEEGLHPKAIINTHAHADHCGGNAYLKRNTEVEIYAPKVEAEMVNAPYIEPLYLFSGAAPIKDLKNKFLMATPSKVDQIIAKDKSELEFEGLKINILPLPGHAPNQIGIGIDNILFCADTIFSKAVLRKHKIPFYMDINKQKQTLDFLKNSDYKLYIPAHGEPIEDIEELVDANLKVIDEIENLILEITKELSSTEEILQEVCNQCQINIERIQQYYLLKTAINAYLSSLYERGSLEISIKENLLSWRNK
ncbi:MULTISPECIES: MBL fold metallo-hydrolase [unclassified Candidatus Frackibacter]|uniref:MBL fold metallo-hydrolase n=1 Tax=unclassified Candidatus Frackibacter TaxID=2648818 RepID=UPI00087F114C|nr:MULTISPECIES: MBL fold metallo-hydrolase [unclassified Candidatus Frackibacter]SDC17617.1 Glyoxylase, beta-lactamase superfamily II [Candidatus Frackibacter sp. WG11]SEM44324.1 Glyoxylase, beta-lactamase superfamily II [Candidatus Frackibacter sp. WG12]SFL46874.1 Glyoxylase, beta-lactamase superfamily II [Candidatus Frackibacter sp. WG13]